MNKRLDENRIQQLAQEITTDLFTNGSKRHATRLVLEGPNKENLGGWSREVVADRITARILTFLERPSR